MSIKASWSRAAAVAVSAAVLVSGCTFIPKEEEVLKPPLVKPTKPTYELYEVKVDNITKQINSTAVFESTNVKYQEFKDVTGKVVGVNVKSGDTVKKGDLLIQLEADGLELNVKEKERDLEKAKLALDQSKQTREEQNMRIRLMELEIAEIKLADARKQLNGKTMVAEMDGLVTAVEPMKVGDIIQLNKTYVTIADPNQLRLSYVAANPNDIADVQVGMPVNVTIKSEKFTGKVVQTPSSSPKTENKQLAEKYSKALFIELEKSPQMPVIGLPVDIIIVTQHKSNVIKIPKAGLGQYLGRTFVKVLDGESVKEIDVEKGLETPSEVEIVRGLKEGQKVILQ
ncbi:efflux RND transporter periplasmic adaptor subunit [Paenibacillus sp. MBLB4367]|uniref:efflux RND transporter periplasmic adaptor subunit n=1 Tax=Paenibacillus sp. MBLB4367 TaxID=3384767 RepID=UPI0039083825